MVFGFQMEVNDVPLLKRDASINLAVFVVGHKVNCACVILSFFELHFQALAVEGVRADVPLLVHGGAELGL